MKLLMRQERCDAFPPGLEKHISNQIAAEECTIDNEVARTAREQFAVNYGISRWEAKESLICLVGSLVVSTACLYAKKTTLLQKIALVVFPLLTLYQWLNFRNQDDRYLQKAIQESNEVKSMTMIGMGANLNGKIYPIGGVPVDLFPFLKGGPRSAISHFAELGMPQVVFYLLMLEENLEARTQKASEALRYAGNEKTALVLINLGAKPSQVEDCLSMHLVKKNLNVIYVLVYAGAKVNGGIEDYKKWESELKHKDSSKLTPLELLIHDLKPGYSSISIFDALESLKIPEQIYTFANSKEDLYEKLNRAGYRIRMSYAERVFAQLFSHRIANG